MNKWLGESFFRVGVVAVSLLAVVGCHSNVDEHEDTGKYVPTIWSFEYEMAQTPISNGLLQFINDPLLTEYIYRVLQHNHDLKAVLHRLQAQEFRNGVSRASYWPSLGISSIAARNNNTPSPVTGKVAGSRLLQLGANLNWEIDIWGRLRDSHKADRYQTEEMAWQFYAAKDSLVSRAIQEWIHAASLKQSFSIANERIKTLESIQERIKNRYENGLGDISELDAARTRLSLAKIELFEVKASLGMSIRQLKLIAGEGFEVDFPLIEEYPIISFPNVFSPDEVIFKRADVKAALTAVSSLKSYEQSVEKNWLPSLFLTGSMSRDRIRIEDFLNTTNVWDWALSASKTLFDAGLSSSQRKAASSETEGARSDFQSIILKAVCEVHDAVANEKKLDLQINCIQDACDTANKNYLYYEKRYLDGLDPIVLMLNAREEQFSITAQYNELKAAKLINRIQTILALGYHAEESDYVGVESDTRTKF